MAYRYEAISAQEQFRLMVLRPESGQDALCADIITAAFSDDIKYDALSYAWGLDVKSQHIDTEGGRLPITESLASALACLRSETESVLLWVDAVCINQDDNHEKNQQVRKIRDIYAGAQSVRVHLGEERDGSELVPALIKALAMTDIAARYGLNTGTITTEAEFEKKVKADKERVLPALEDHSWEAVRAVLRRPWFRRVWVIQEFTVASDVMFHCGNWRISWLQFSNALWQFHPLNISVIFHAPNYTDEMTTQTRHGFLSFWSLLWLRRDYTAGHRLELISLLGRFRGALATKGRDHLFAMLGLACDADDAAFNPDYDEPLSRVVCRYAAAFVRRGYGERLLAEAGLVAGAPPRFPSWIPDWTSSETDFSMLGNKAMRVYSASGDTKLHMSVSADQTLLHMTGSFFDTIVEVGMAFAEGGESRVFRSREFLSVQVEEAETMVSKLSHYPSGGSVQSAFRATVVCDRRNRYGPPSPHIRASEDFLRHYDRAREIMRHWSDAKADRSEEDEPGTFITRVFETFDYLRFCVTEKGYMGLFPLNAQPGDAVFVLHGLQTPFAMRRTAGRGEDQLRLVGQCYIHGIMDGEALDLPGYEPKGICIW